MAVTRAKNNKDAQEQTDWQAGRRHIGRRAGRYVSGTAPEMDMATQVQTAEF